MNQRTRVEGARYQDTVTNVPLDDSFSPSARATCSVPELSTSFVWASTAFTLPLMQSTKMIQRSSELTTPAAATLVCPKSIFNPRVWTSAECQDFRRDVATSPLC